MRSFLIAAAVLAASTGVAGAVCMNPYSGMATGDDCSVNRDSWNTYYGDQYTVIDKNGDGSISAEEWSMANTERYSTEYTGLDTNKDGMVSPEELKAANSMRDYSNMALDANNDGMISADEWNTATATFDYNNVDRDQDGMVSTEEWQQGYDKDFDAFDTDKNGTLSEKELQGQTQKGS